MDIATLYAQFTQNIVDITGMSRPMLHVHAGMSIYLLSQLGLGTRRGSLLAITLVLQAELLNETMQRFYHGSWRWDDTIPDVLLTLFWPAMCWLVSSLRRRFWRRSQSRRLMRQRPGQAYGSHMLSGGRLGDVIQ